MNHKTSKAILDNYTLNLVGNDLILKNEAYYIIFRILLETGMPLEEVFKLRICDINKNAITFSPAHKGYLRTEKLTADTQEAIRSYINGKADEELAFPSKADPNKPIFIRSFQNALAETSKRLGLTPPISATSLRKTFIYNLYIKTHDTKKIYKITGIRSINQLYEYLGISAPPSEEGTERMSSKNPYNILVGEGIIDSTKKNTNITLDKICESLKTPEYVTFAYCKEALILAHSIEKALARFNAISGDNSLSKDIHKKSGDTATNC